MTAERRRECSPGHRENDRLAATSPETHMRTLATVTALILSLSLCAFAQTNRSPTVIAAQPSWSEQPETSHLAFVTEFVRELAAIENIRASAEKEPKQDTTDVFLNTVHSGTLFQLELRTQIGVLKSMRLKPPFEGLIPVLTDFYEHKITLWQKIIDISDAFIGGPKADVDYGKLLAEAPKIRARLDYIDHTIFAETTPLIFETLIDPNPDSKNHVSHLIITKAERAGLLDDLTTDFGSKLDRKNQNYTVSAAKLLKAYLLKDYKCSDEPWE
jgi:hypothetical protein